jgi:hypothetical protein
MSSEHERLIIQCLVNVHQVSPISSKYQSIWSHNYHENYLPISVTISTYIIIYHHISSITLYNYLYNHIHIYIHIIFIYSFFLGGYHIYIIYINHKPSTFRGYRAAGSRGEITGVRGLSIGLMGTATGTVKICKKQHVKWISWWYDWYVYIYIIKYSYIII